MSARGEFRQALIDGDVDYLVRAWGTLFPGSEQAPSWQEAEQQMHIARTAAASVPFRLRAYSHHWLVERSLPSMLPEDLKPKAEQFKPTIAPCVGVAYGITGSNLKKELLGGIVPLVAGAMTKVVSDNAELITADPVLLRHKMLDARLDEMKRLVGTTRLREIAQ